LDADMRGECPLSGTHSIRTASISSSLYALLIACCHEPRYIREEVSIVRSVVVLIVAAVIVVPAVMRAGQHVELRDSTRLSIRLNWQSDAPPQKHVADTNQLVRKHLAVVAVSVQPLQTTHVVFARHIGEEPSPTPVSENAPDLFRGPPFRSL
jgi:hypothetical protein